MKKLAFETHTTNKIKISASSSIKLEPISRSIEMEGRWINSGRGKTKEETWIVINPKRFQIKRMEECAKTCGTRFDRAVFAEYPVCVYTNGGSMQIQGYYAVRGAGGLRKEISLRRRALELESWCNEENGEKGRQKDNKK